MADKTREALTSLLWPSSVVVIGAGANAETMNGAPVYNLQDFGFQGTVYPVSINRSSVHGFRCYRDLDEIEGPIDTAVIAVRAEQSLDWLEACAEKGILSATIVGAGFSEGAAKESGEALTQRLQSIVASTGIRVLGPNTAGLINLRHHYVPRAALNHFSPEQSRVGSSAIICQSGAISNILYNKCQAHHVGVAYSLATGDQLDLDVWELIEYALADDAVTNILCVVEGVGDAGRFIDVSSKAAQCGKPVVLLKLGKSDAGARMVATHSGSMAGSYRVFRAVANQLGIIEAEDFDQFWELASLFSRWGTERVGQDSRCVRRPALGVIAISGGDAAFIADAAAEHGFDFPAPSDKFEQFISQSFSFAAAGNPFDSTGEVIAKPDLLNRAATAFVESPGFDYVLAAAPVFRSELANRLYPPFVEGLNCPGVKVVVAAWSAGSLTREGINIFRGGDLPVMEHCGRAVRAIRLYDHWVSHSPDGARLVYPDPSIRWEDIFYSQLKEDMAAAGIPFGPSFDIPSRPKPDEYSSVFGAGEQYVLKLNCKTQVHKSTRGFVNLGINSMESLHDAIARMPTDAEHVGWVLEKQLRGDIEIYIGGATDQDFGKILFLGFGGRFAEYLGGNEVWVGDFETDRIRDWIATTAVGRSVAAMDNVVFGALVACFMAAGRWYLNSPTVSAFDLNPVLVDLHNKTLHAVDCRAQ